MDNSKESLEQVLTAFSHKVCERYGISFFNGGYVIHLEEEMYNDVVMLAGNPVQIKLHWRLLADAMQNNKMIEFKNTLQSCLEVASRHMLYTLGNNPPAPIITKDKGDKKWRKREKISQVIPNLIAPSRVSYEIHIIVTAHDSQTGLEVCFSGDEEEGASIESLKRLAHKTLSEEVLNERTRQLAREAESRARGDEAENGTLAFRDEEKAKRDRASDSNGSS